MSIIIDEEFRSLIPPLSAEESQQLTVNLLRDGVLDPLKVWQETGILVDGHNRYEICTTHELTIPAPQLISFKDRDAAKEWIIKNQFGRRNLTRFVRAELALRLEPLIAAKAKENQRLSEGKGAKGSQISENLKVDRYKEIADLAGVSHDTIAKVKAILESAPEETKEKLRRGDDKISIHSAHSTIASSVRKKEVAEQVFETTISKDMQAIVSTGQKFACIYADPPWQYGNQSTRASTDKNYVTMTFEDIQALPVSQLAADEAHLHLWTTNGFLREAFELMEAWGFEYKSCFVWVKPQMGIGNYWRVSHEFLLLGVRGSFPFIDKSLRSWAELKRGKHSAKPRKVREMIERASPGPRIELFGRSEIDGWTVFGNEIPKDLFSEGLPREE